MLCCVNRPTVDLNAAAERGVPTPRARLPWRLQAEHLELLGPVARQIGKTREADAAGQAVVGDGLDQARGEKGQREQHCGRSDGALLPLRKIGDVPR